jgi:hypothetical protein
MLRHTQWFERIFPSITTAHSVLASDGISALAFYALFGDKVDIICEAADQAIPPSFQSATMTLNF